MKKSSQRLSGKKNPNPLFHQKNVTDDENSVIVINLIKKSRKSGKLNLSNQHLTQFPQEVFKLGDVHSDDNDVRFDVDPSEDSKNWWELEALHHLDLSCNCIHNVPVCINQLDGLTVLDMHSNNLSCLPAEIGDLIKLRKLDVGHNKVEHLPSTLSTLKYLQVLNMSHNKLTELPICLYDLVMLHELDVSYNIISVMPPGIGFLTRLKVLNASHNSLAGVPNDLPNCRALIDLDLSHNQISSEELPPLGELHQVQLINLHHNRITALPKLGGCSALKEIHLGFNAIKEVTVEELSSLSHVQVINLRDNKIEQIPRELSCMQNLVRLDLSNNNLKELPATLALLPHLQSLLVDGNGLRSIRRDILTGSTQRLLRHLKETLPFKEEDASLLSKLPCQSASGNNFPDRFSMRCSKSVSLAGQELCNVPDVVFEEAMKVPCTMFDLSKNRLTQVPEGLWMCNKHIVDLNLSYNLLSCVTDHLGSCCNLVYLNLANNQLSALPATIAACLQLREIILSSNRLTELPSGLLKIKGLETLVVRDNKITQIDIEELSNLTSLATLDLSNNSLGRVPPPLGNMTHLRHVALEGNGLRAPGPALLAKGTDAVLSWLRDKIPTQSHSNK